MAIDRSGTSVLYSVCTSSTRPTGPTEGMMIYETDTDSVAFYNGSSWISIGSVGSGVGGGYAPTGSLLSFGGAAAPTGWLLCDGAAVNRTTYSNLFGVIAPTKGTFTVTIASPGVISLTGHGMSIGDAFYVTTTGSTPTNLTINTIYYVASGGFGANSFQFAATRGGASVNTSGSQSGTHTLVYCPYGLGDGSTTFNIPDLRGRTMAGKDNMGGSAASRLTSTGSGIYGEALGAAGGTETHTLTGAESGTSVHTHGITDPGHAHNVDMDTTAYAAGLGESANFGQSPVSHPATGGIALSNTTGITINNSSAANASNAHQNTQPTSVLNYIIKT